MPHDLSDTSASVESHTHFETRAPYYTQNGSDMEIKWIEDFIALSQYQSFSRAAEFRNVTQSGFSRRIQSLEQWVGADLIDRSSFPPTLTPPGNCFVRRRSTYWASCSIREPSFASINAWPAKACRLQRAIRSR